jgi:cell division protein ZapA
MSQQEPKRVSVRIMDKDYSIACPHEERTALLDAAEFLNLRMQEVRDSGKVVGLDRIAVVVALNLANELLHLKQDTKQENDVTGRIRALRERVDSAIEKGKQLEL